MDWMKELKQPAKPWMLYLEIGSPLQLTEERPAWDRMAGIIHALLYGGV